MGVCSSQGSELSGWTTGHFTEDGFDIFQNFPDLNSILWDAEDKGMVPKLTPNHHVPMPNNFEANSSVSKVIPRKSLSDLSPALSTFDPPLAPDCRGDQGHNLLDEEPSLRAGC